MMDGDSNLEKVTNEDLLKWVMFARASNKMREKAIQIPNRNVSAKKEQKV